MDEWAPAFAVRFGVCRADLLDMSVPMMLDHLDYWSEMTEEESGAGG